MITGKQLSKIDKKLVDVDQGFGPSTAFGMLKVGVKGNKTASGYTTAGGYRTAGGYPIAGGYRTAGDVQSSDHDLQGEGFFDGIGDWFKDTVSSPAKFINNVSRGAIHAVGALGGDLSEHEKHMIHHGRLSRIEHAMGLSPYTRDDHIRHVTSLPSAKRAKTKKAGTLLGETQSSRTPQYLMDDSDVAFR